MVPCVPYTMRPWRFVTIPWIPWYHIPWVLTVFERYHGYHDTIYHGPLPILNLYHVTMRTIYHAPLRYWTIPWYHAYHIPQISRNIHGIWRCGIFYLYHAMHQWFRLNYILLMERWNQMCSEFLWLPRERLLIEAANRKIIAIERIGMNASAKSLRWLSRRRMYLRAIGFECCIRYRM